MSKERWDYWELTADEPVIDAELGLYRSAGGSCLVDVTLDGVGRDPGRLAALSERTGLHIVMGCGWYREPYYPPEARIDRRSVDDLADELVREATDGVAGTGIRPGIIGEIGTDKPWLSPAEERVHRAAARAARRTGLAITTHAVMSRRRPRPAPRLRGGGGRPGPSRDRPRRLVPDPRTTTSRSSSRGANVEFDFLGMSFTPQERKGEPRIVRLLHGAARHAAMPTGSCSARTSATTASSGTTTATATRTSSETFLPRLREAGVSDAEIEQLTVTNPRRA